MESQFKLSPLEQLQAFADWEDKHRPGTDGSKHISRWAYDEIIRLQKLIDKPEVVPDKATPEMEQAAEKYWNDRRWKGLSEDPRTWAGVYAAMITACPQPPAPGVDVESDLGLATVWHEGSQSFYDAKLLRKMSREEVCREELAAGGENPDVDDTSKSKQIADKPARPVDVEVVREVIAEMHRERKSTDGDYYHELCGKQAEEWADQLARAIGDGA